MLLVDERILKSATPPTCSSSLVSETSMQEDQDEDSVSEASASSCSFSASARRRRWVILRDEVQLQEEIGRGRYGVAFRGLYKGRVVAVKVSTSPFSFTWIMILIFKVSNPLRNRADYDAAQEGIIREVGTFCRCKHPSLVRYPRCSFSPCFCGHIFT